MYNCNDNLLNTPLFSILHNDFLTQITTQLELTQSNREVFTQKTLEITIETITQLDCSRTDCLIHKSD
jgi:hypothetical protein